MKCQRCNKVVTLHITEVDENGDYEALDLCEDCGAAYLNQHPIKPQGNLPLTSFTSGVTSCDQCGLKFNDFRNSGRLGCPKDYEVFREELLPLLEGVHGMIRHAGKTPKRRRGEQASQQLIARLKQELKMAIQNEAYEEASRIRDRLRELGEK
ncbi:MAG: UvrB/UvrC motif-containing protein [Gemmataceae bacterium]|jgi:protein arginine kinase activator|nr:UvrB/UvrC motif-containing protein [Gemmataceae bacterium]